MNSAASLAVDGGNSNSGVSIFSDPCFLSFLLSLLFFPLPFLSELLSSPDSSPGSGPVGPLGSPESGPVEAWKTILIVITAVSVLLPSDIVYQK